MTGTPPPRRSHWRSGRAQRSEPCPAPQRGRSPWAAVQSRVHSPMLSMASPSRLFIVQVTGTSFMCGACVDSQKMCERDLCDDVSAGAWHLCAVVSRLPSPGMSNGLGHCERLRVGGNGRRDTLCSPWGCGSLLVMRSCVGGSCPGTQHRRPLRPRRRDVG